MAPVNRCRAYFSWPPGSGAACQLAEGHTEDHRFLMPAVVAEHVNAGYRGEADDRAADLIRKFRVGADFKTWDTPGYIPVGRH